MRGRPGFKYDSTVNVHTCAEESVGDRNKSFEDARGTRVAPKA